MTLPRENPPGTFAKLTRRTERGRMCLRPSAEMNDLYVYCTAVAQAETGVELHAVACMGNHAHEAASDHEGYQLGPFKERKNHLIAYGVKSLFGVEGAVFDRASVTHSDARTDAMLLNDIAYVLAQPQKHFLVRRPHQYPGVVTLLADLRATGAYEVRAKRPTCFAADNARLPEEATLKVRLPRRLIEEYGGLEALCDAIQARIDEIVKQAISEAKARGQRTRPIGREACLRGSRDAAVPKRLTPRSDPLAWAHMASRRGGSTRISGGDPQGRRRVVRHQAAWLGAYRRRRELWLSGDYTTPWPAGTQRMARLFGGVCCAVDPP